MTASKRLALVRCPHCGAKVTWRRRRGNVLLTNHDNASRGPCEANRYEFDEAKLIAASRKERA